MKVRHKSHVKWASLLLCILALTVFLVACGSTGDTNTATSTPTPTRAPTGKAYTGTGFILYYPLDWMVETQNIPQMGEVFVFNPANASQTYKTGFSIIVSPPGQSNGTDAAMNTYLKILKGGTQPDTSVTPTVTVAGDVWKQSGFTGNVQGESERGIVLADYHAANQRLYGIAIGDTAAAFNQDNTNIFQPVLQSFKFV